MEKKELYNAIIISGGIGSRLGLNKPKLLIKINGVYFIDYLYQYLKKNGFNKIVILGGYGFEKIIKHIKKKKLDIDFIYEKKPLGTGGSLFQNINKFEKNFLVILGDVYTFLNIKKYFKSHIKSNFASTIMCHSNDHIQDSNIAIRNKDNNLVKILKKNKKRKKIKENLAFSGIYFFSRPHIKKLNFKNKKILDLENDLIAGLLKKKYLIKISKFYEFLIDFGTKKRIALLRKIIYYNKNFINNLRIFHLDEVDKNSVCSIVNELKKNKLTSTNFLFVNKHMNYSKQVSFLSKIESILANRNLMFNSYFFLKDISLLKKISKKFVKIKNIKI